MSGRDHEPEGRKKPSGFAMLLLHLHPRVVPEEALRFTRTCGLGGMAVVLLVLLAGTGALLLMAYEPSVERAYASVERLRADAVLGGFVRNIHFWAANILVLVAGLHLLRVFYTGAFHPPRRLNWVVGLLLLGLVLASNFTGYLLPWDQLAFWAVTVATGMLAYVPLAGPMLAAALRGGPEVGAATLSRFFVLHIALVPIVGAILAAFHFWLVRKAGGVVFPRAAGPGTPPRVAMVPTSPDLVLRELVAALCLIAGVVLAAAVLDAPLLAQANPGMSPNPAKAPWYFMGMQELLVHLHPLFAVVVVPVAASAFLVALPYLSYGEAPTGQWFHSSNGRRTCALASAVGLASGAVGIVASEQVVRLATRMPSLSPAVSTGVIPVAALGLVVVAFLALMRRRYGASRIESAQALFTLLMAWWVVLTLAGVLFRGTSMRLVWPWAAHGGP